jgi:tetratricopeptide (TPR) repeat protein/O-antigen ligase
VTRTARLLDGAIEAGVVALLLFAPLPHGSVRPWAEVAIEGLVVLLVVLSIVRMLAAREVSVRLTPLLWPGVAMAVLVAWQVISPTGSVSPHATQASARLYGAYLGLLLVVSSLSITRARVARLATVMVVWSVLLAGVGFARLLGVAVPGLGPAWTGMTGRLTSTFVNPNHQALYFSLALFVALGLVLRPSTHWGRIGSTRSGQGGESGALSGVHVRVLLTGGAFMLALALVLTLSRGGMVSALAGLLAMLSLAIVGRVPARAVVPMLFVVFGALVYVGWVGLDAVADRFALVVWEQVSDVRWPIWESTLRVVGDAPIAGVGLGAFQDGFSAYRPLEVPAEKVVDYAHNDFLQLLAETGIAGLLIALWAFTALLTFTVRRWRVRRDPFVRGFVLSGVGGVVAAMVHSVVDFGLHMPANAVVLVVIAGLLPLVVTLYDDGVEERVQLARWQGRVMRRGRAVGLALAVLGAVVLLPVLVPHGVAGWHLATAAEITRTVRQTGGVATQRDLTQVHAALRRAIDWDPGNPMAWAELADVSTQLAGRVWIHGLMPAGERLQDTSVHGRLRAAEPLVVEAYGAYRESLRLRPRGSDVHERFGWFLGDVERIRRSVGGGGALGPVAPELAGLLRADRSVIPEALTHFREAVRWDPNNAYRHRSLGLFALSVAGPESGREIASTAIGQALDLRPNLLAGILDELLARRVDDTFLLTAMPRSFEVILDLGRELERRGRPRAAAAAFEEAVRLAPTPVREVDARLAYARVLIGRKEPSGALDQAQRALVLAPKEAEVFAVLATIHAQTNQGLEAETALATAVALAESGPTSRRNRLRGELAALFVQRGQWERAMTLWREVLRERPNDAWAHLELGRILQQRGDAAGALHEYRTASAVGGEDSGLHWTLARALRDGGYLREARTSYEAARRLRPADGDLGVELGDLYARIGLWDQAIEQYREVLRREPDHTAAQRGLASVKAGAGS